MKKIVEMLIARLKESAASVEDAEDKAAVESAIEALEQDFQAADEVEGEEATAKYQAVIESVAEVQNQIDGQEAPDLDHEKLKKAVADLIEGMIELSEPDQAQAGIEQTINRLLLCRSDLVHAIKYLQEVKLLAQLDLNTVQDDEDEMGFAKDNASAGTGDNNNDSDDGDTREGDDMDPQKLIKLAEVIAKVQTEEVQTLWTELTALAAKSEPTDEQKTRMDEIVTALEAVEIPQEDDTQDDDTQDAGGNDDTQDDDTQDDEEDVSLANLADLDTLSEGQMRKLILEMAGEITAFKQKDVALARMKTLKEKGLDVVFATDEQRAAETEFLMGATDEQFAAHVALLEQAKEAFKTVGTSQASEEGSEDGDDGDKSGSPFLAAQADPDKVKEFAAQASAIGWDADEDDEDDE